MRHTESCPSWPKEHDWKSCNRHKRFEGSNPLLSAKNPHKTVVLCGFFFYFAKHLHIAFSQIAANL